MNVKSTSILLATALTLLACGDKGSKDGTAAVTSDGLCTQQTVTAYNDIKYKLDSYLASRNTDYLRGAQKACQNFKALIGDQSCKAANSTTYDEMYISANSAEPRCSNVNQALASTTAEPLPKPVTPTPQQPGVLTNGFVVIIKDAASLKSLLGTIQPTQGLQDGKIVNLQGLSSVQPLCLLMSMTIQDLQSIAILNFEEVQLESQKLTASTTDQKLSLICRKFDSQPWTLQDVKSVFGAMADVY